VRHQTDPRNAKGEQIRENTIQKRITSTSLYYPTDPLNKDANKVAWLSKLINGPYAGKHERLAKCTIKLQDHSAGAFFVFYNSIQSFLGSTGFNQELLPALQFIPDDLDLAVTPIDINIPHVGAYGGGGAKTYV
jgi:hypothetical protein